MMKMINLLRSYLFLVLLFAVMVVPCGFSSAQAQTLKEYFEKGQEWFDQGDYVKAIQSYEKAVDMDPNFAPVYNALGLAHQALGSSTKDVIWFFKVAVDIDPQYVDAYSNMCRAYHQANEYEAAEAACLKALAIDPDYGAAQMSLAWVYLLGRSNPTEALLYFEKVRAKVNSPTIYLGMGMAYSMQRDNARVLEMITTLRSMGANDYAAELEKNIRTHEPAPAPATAPSDLAQPAPQSAGQIIQSPSQLPMPTVKDEDLPPVSGQMRIRLKGQMMNPTAPDNSGKHPGSL